MLFAKQEQSKGLINPTSMESSIKFQSTERGQGKLGVIVAVGLVGAIAVAATFAIYGNKISQFFNPDTDVDKARHALATAQEQSTQIVSAAQTGQAGTATRSAQQTESVIQTQTATHIIGGLKIEATNLVEQAQQEANKVLGVSATPSPTNTEKSTTSPTLEPTMTPSATLNIPEYLATPEPIATKTPETSNNNVFDVLSSANAGLVRLSENQRIAFAQMLPNRITEGDSWSTAFFAGQQQDTFFSVVQPGDWEAIGKKNEQITYTLGIVPTEKTVKDSKQNMEKDHIDDGMCLFVRGDGKVSVILQTEEQVLRFSATLVKDKIEKGSAVLDVIKSNGDTETITIEKDRTGMDFDIPFFMADTGTNRALSAIVIITPRTDSMLKVTQGVCTGREYEDKNKQVGFGFSLPSRNGGVTNAYEKMMEEIGVEKFVESSSIAKRSSAKKTAAARRAKNRSDSPVALQNDPMGWLAEPKVDNTQHMAFTRYEETDAI